MKKILFIMIIGLYLGINPATSQYSKLWDFDGTVSGSVPKGSLTLSGDVLYGMTSDGGAYDKGCIFKINNDGSGYTNLFDFSGTTGGSEPYGSLVLSGDVLYGMTTLGGTNDKGCIFKINTDGSGFTQMLSFSGITDGAYPYGSLVLSGSELYGMTFSGGANNLGCIFMINTSGTVFTQLHNFSGTDGSYPYGSLTLSGNVLYGMTLTGGANSMGCIFKINTDGNGYNPLLSFDGTTSGSVPRGSLILSGDALYGMTSYGGTNSMGCLFQINTDGTGYSRLVDFDGTDNGGYPQGSLTLSDMKLYGMTTEGGTNGYGCIFEYIPSRDRFAKLLDFNNTGNGGFPIGDLTLSGRALYGMTVQGGTNNDGVIFKYFLPPATQTSNISFPFIGINVADISWTSGNGEKRVVFVKEGTSTDAYPEDNTTYTASPNWDSKGSQLGTSGYYCVYNGTESMVSVISLTPGSTYTVRAFEYNGQAGNEQYQTSTETWNPNTFHTESVNAIQTDRENPVHIFSDGNDIYTVISHCDGKAQLAVYNLSGVCIVMTNVLVEGQNTISADYLPGIYLVRLVLDSELYTGKIIIK